MTRLRRWLAALAVPAAVLTTAALAAPAASAAPLQPQQFIITGSSSSPNGVVDAFGPLFGTGTDSTLTATLDRFSFPRGSVLVRHTDVSSVPLSVNFRTCVASATARGSWQIVPFGTRLFRFARGSGFFTFRERVILSRFRNGRCNTNPNRARFASYQVDAFGQSALR
jgi:hypothetical protein